MKKLNWIISVLVITTLIISVTATAISISANEKAKGKAPEITPPGLEKIVFIHYKKGFGKPGNICGNDVCEPGEKKACPQDCPSNGNGEESPCYKFLQGKARWKWQEPYYVSSTVDVAAFNAGVAEWEAYGGDIFGQQISGEKPWDEYDNANAITYGDFIDDCEKVGEDPCVIAVTGIWILGNRILEYDMRFDSDFTWGDATINNATMDWQNIATHELGHAAGLGDLYEDTGCFEETMYGYSGEGETKKRDLNTGDIAGIQKLY